MNRPLRSALSLLTGVGLLLSACAPAATPTAAPKPAESKPAAAAPAAPAAKPAEAPKPTEAPKPAEAPKPTEAPKPAAIAKPAEVKPAAPAGGAGSAIDQVKIGAPVEIVFWHTQTGPLAEALNRIVNDFNTKNPNIKVKPEFAGNYTQTYQKAMAAIQGGGLPQLAVAYESMIADYMKANAVVPLDDYVASSLYGLSKEDLDDIYPFALSRNRFAQFGNKMLSFPFTTSNLNLYYNADMLKQVGVNGPPETWDDFYAACKAIKAKLQKQCYAISVDASTVHGMIFSRGGQVVNAQTLATYYDQPAAVETFEFYERLIKEDLAYQIKPGSFDDQNDLANEKVAFMIRSSTTRPFLDPLIKDKFKWGMALIPQGKENKEKSTVLFGANIAMFKSTPEKQLASWMFMKYFISTAVTSDWGAVGGYTPVRKSGANVDPYKTYLTKTPEINRVALDNMAFARPEPNLIGYQDIRPAMDDIVVAVLAGKSTGKDAAKKAKEQSDRLLKEKNS
ncbi:MAG: ABC transporter substrate-binding protein [Chloroflexota bacterium]|nr:MAG: ABC transporter substrate-binding protein [Chloroflexota bacterium]